MQIIKLKLSSTEEIQRKVSTQSKPSPQANNTVSRKFQKGHFKAFPLVFWIFYTVRIPY